MKNKYLSRFKKTDDKVIHILESLDDTGNLHPKLQLLILNSRQQIALERDGQRKKKVRFKIDGATIDR